MKVMVMVAKMIMVMVMVMVKPQSWIRCEVSSLSEHT